MSDSQLDVNDTESFPRRARKQVPMYQVLKADLEKAIREGELKPGQVVPSESELIAKYHVSSTTARRCLDELQAEGLLERKRGKGTFVSNLAATLKKERIAVVVKDLFSLAHPFLATVVGAIERRLEAEGAHVVIVRAHVGDSLPESGSHLLELVQHEGVQHVMLLSNMPLRMVQPLVDHGIKCLGVNTRYLDARIPHVSHDSMASFDLALRELTARGHRRITILVQERPMREVGVMNSTSLLREVYQNLCLEIPDLPAEPDIREVAGLDGLRLHVNEALKGRTPATGFYCWDEVAGLEAMRVLADEGIRVPRDVSVVASRILPASPVACVDVPLELIAEISAEAMLGWMKGVVPDNRLIRPTGFLARESLGPVQT